MKILIAPERFHPTMKAQAVAQAMTRGLQRVSPHFECFMYPLASGGVGTTDIVVRAAKGRVRHETLALPNRHRREVKWALLPDGTAIFDARDVLGDPDGPSQLNQTYTDSSPLGIMIRHLLAYHPTQIAIALGDVLAADGGMGLLSHFGIRPHDAEGDTLVRGSRQLLRLDGVDFSGLEPPPVPLLALTDHQASWNSRVHHEDFRLDLIHGGLHDAAMRLGDALSDHVSMPLGDMPGTGVGGGLGLALTFLGAHFVAGSEYLARWSGLAETMWQMDWVLTGSIRLGEESLHQAVGSVARLARDAGVPAVALTVEMASHHTVLYDEGLIGLYSVLDRPRSAKEVQRTLPALIEKAAYRTGIWMQAMSDPS